MSFERDPSRIRLREIQVVTSKAWFAGSDRFKGDFERKTKRPAIARPQGGDRRSARWKDLNQRL